MARLKDAMNGARLITNAAIEARQKAEAKAECLKILLDEALTLASDSIAYTPTEYRVGKDWIDKLARLELAVKEIKDDKV